MIRGHARVPHFLFALSMLAGVSSAEATVGKPDVPFGGLIQDQDLSGEYLPRRILAPGAELSADRVETAAAPQQLVIQVLREVGSELQPVSGLVFTAASPSFGTMPATTDSQGEARWASNCSDGPRIRVRAQLKNSFFSIASSGVGGRPYPFVAEVGCEGLTRLIVKTDSDSGQALGIWQVAMRAQLKLQSAIGLQFWKRPVVFAWPGDGDYYTRGVVTLTRGDHWDVVGHELGHAIYDLGGIGSSEGGQHRIDECYSSTLALSEGWASFFSAFVSISSDDPDAKFEYMVPRRAPIRFETIPADVCAGEENEWRVTGFFWDLFDKNADGETVEQLFSSLWNPLQDSRVSSSSQAAKRFEIRGVMPRGDLEQVWRKNFLK
ncbi:MAG: hypothetical protein KGQ59_03710 [Bdellovibrionales bacterium]|nr:hypothetical protein [Bdellovibrionales bacterium]